MYYTANEKAAIFALLNSCLDAMCGSNMADLAADPLTWVDTDALLDAGWTQKQAEGTFGSLVEKGVIVGDRVDGFVIAHEDPEICAIWEEQNANGIAADTPEEAAAHKEESVLTASAYDKSERLDFISDALAAGYTRSKARRAWRKVHGSIYAK